MAAWVPLLTKALPLLTQIASTAIPHFTSKTAPNRHPLEISYSNGHTSITGRRVVGVLERLADLRGLPASITVDHGPEFEGQVLDA
jgi:hypothetical protein